MSEAYVVDAVRTAVGKKGGALGRVHPADLGAVVITHVLARNQVASSDGTDDHFATVRRRVRGRQTLRRRGSAVDELMDREPSRY